MSERFPSRQRLKSRKTIEKLFKSGRAITSPPLRAICIWETGNLENLQAGFSAPSRNFKKAVDRNRVKRLMREAFRLQKTGLEEALLKGNRKLSLFFIYTARELPEFTLIKEKISVILKKLIAQAYEGNSSGS